MKRAAPLGVAEGLAYRRGTLVVARALTLLVESLRCHFGIEVAVHEGGDTRRGVHDAGRNASLWACRVVIGPSIIGMMTTRPIVSRAQAGTLKSVHPGARRS